MEIVIIVVGIIGALLGIIMSMLPALPGPVVSFLSLAFLFVASDRAIISSKALAVFGAITIVILIVENFVPAAAAKFAGASRRGIAGSIIGTLIGLILFPPLGAFAGALLGALIGELYVSPDLSRALRSTAGAFAGTIGALVIRTIFSISILIYLIGGIINSL